MTNSEFADTIINLSSYLSVGLLIKFMVLSLTLFYAFFAFALWRQVQLMTKIVEIEVSTILRVLGVMHFLAAVLLFLGGMIAL